MAVRWQNVEMPLGGADQYTDAPHVLPGQMRELENIRLRRPPTHSKRYGFERLSLDLLDSTDTIENGRRLVGHLHETVLCTSDKLFTYSHLTDEWAARGELSQCFVERRSTWAETSNLSYYDGAYNQNLFVCARTGGGRPNAIVIDMTTETVVSVQALAFVSDHVRVLAVGDYIYVISGANYTRIDVTSGSYEFPAIAAFSGVSNVGSDLLADVAALGTSHIVIAYADSSSGDITVHRIAVSNNTSDQSATKAEDPLQTIAVHATAGEGVLVVYDDSSGTRLRAWSLSVTLTEVLIDNLASTVDVHHAGIARIDADKRVVVWRAEGTSDTFYRAVSLSTGVLGSAAVDVDSVSPASKPFQFGTRTYGWVAYKSEGGTDDDSGLVVDGGDQETFYLLQYTDDDGAVLDPAVWTGTAAVGIAECIDFEDDSSDPINFLPSVSHIGGSRYECPVLIKDRFQFASDEDEPVITARKHLERLRADFDVAGKLHQTAEWNGGLVIAGGRPSWYDGNTCVELGFAWFPEAFELTLSTGILAAGDYDICFVYEWTDALGNIHRSAPSTSVKWTSAGNSSIEVDWQETLLSNKAITNIPTVGAFTDNRFILYRTILGPGPIFYRDPLAVAGGAATAGNTASYGTQGDTDADLILSEVLYTTGGILENTVPPPCKHVVKHIDRLWLGGLEEPDLLWFSQPAVFREGPRFNPQLSIRTPRVLTGLASMDAKLVAFHEDGITCVEGNGPPASGGLDLGLILYEVPSDVGCVDWRSICVYRDGVFFQSRKGIYRLGRDLSVTFVGAPVKGYLEDFPTVTSAVDLPDRSEVVFGVTDGTNSRRLVFNYEIGEWSVDTCPADALAAAIVYNATTDKWVYAYVAEANGAVFREKDGGYDDLDEDGTVTFITSKWVTPWFRLNTLQDWLRVKGVTLLGTRPGAASSAGVRVRVGFDYEDTTWAETHTFTAAEVDDAIVNGRMQLEVQFGRMRCEAVRLEIIDTGPAEQGSAGIELQSLVFTGGFQARDRYRVSRDTARK